MTDRGSGRTSRQLAALPDGAFYLVPHRPAASHCEMLLQEAGRSRRAIRFITATQGEASIWGAHPSAWDVDHSYHEVAGARGRVMHDLLWMAAGKGPLSEQ